MVRVEGSESFPAYSLFTSIGYLQRDIRTSLKVVERIESRSAKSLTKTKLIYSLALEAIASILLYLDVHNIVALLLNGNSAMRMQVGRQWTNSLDGPLCSTVKVPILDDVQPH